MLDLVDLIIRECLAIRIGRRPRSTDVLDVPSDRFILRGVPDHIGPDNGPEGAAEAARARIAPGPPASTPASPWRERILRERHRDALRDREISDSLAEAKIVIGRSGRHCTAGRPHALSGDKPPAPEVVPWPAPPSRARVAGTAGPRHGSRPKPDRPIGAGHSVTSVRTPAVGFRPCNSLRTRPRAHRA